jgi:hypothetical protein
MTELRDLVAQNGPPPLPFQYEPGILDLNENVDPGIIDNDKLEPTPTILKFTERHQMRKM